MRRLYVWLSIIIGLVLFIGVSMTVSWRDASGIIEHANPVWLAIYLGATVLILLFHALRWQVIARSKGIDVTLAQSFAYRLARFGISFITPGPRVGGEALGAGLITRHRRGGKKIPYGEALSTLAIDRTVELQMDALLFFIGVLWLIVIGGIPVAVKIPLFAFIAAFLAVMAAFAVGIIRGRVFATRFLRRFISSKKILREMDHFERTMITFYRSQPRPFIIAHLLSGVAWLISLAEYKYVLLLLGYDAPLYAIFLIYLFIGIAYTIPIPLALGSLEGLQATAFTILGLSTVGGVLLAIITRARDLVISVFGFGVLTYYGFVPKTPSRAVR